jgi:hypothetical protein
MENKDKVSVRGLTEENHDSERLRREFGFKENASCRAHPVGPSVKRFVLSGQKEFHCDCFASFFLF